MMKGYRLFIACLFIFWSNFLKGQTEQKVYTVLSEQFCDSVNAEILRYEVDELISYNVLWKYGRKIFNTENAHYKNALVHLHELYPKIPYDSITKRITDSVLHQFTSNCDNYKFVLNYRPILDTTEQDFWMSVCNCMYKNGFKLGSYNAAVLENCKFDIYWGVGSDRDFYGLQYGQDYLAMRWLRVQCPKMVEDQLSRLSKIFSTEYTELRYLENVLDRIEKNIIPSVAESNFVNPKDFSLFLNSEGVIHDSLKLNYAYRVMYNAPDKRYYVVDVRDFSVLFGLKFSYDPFISKVVQLAFIPRSEINKLTKLEEELKAQFPSLPPLILKKIVFLSDFADFPVIPPPSMQEPEIPSEPPK
ncbi:MAG: hypothetical protein K1X55_07290 [Chitinophagales bacterium]|nr:hypothetical protein [Chitinophagales bacterium]